MSLISDVPIGLIGKEFAQDDFRVLRRVPGLDDGVEKRLFDCLNLHIDTAGAVTAFVFWKDQSPWVSRAEVERSADTAGRVRSRIEFARIERTLTAGESVAVLTRAAETPLDAHTHAAGGRFESIRALAPSETERAHDALLALLLGAEIAIVSDAREAVWVIEELGHQDLPILLNCTGKHPWRTQPGSMVLTVASVGSQPSATVREVAGWLAGRRIPNVPGLRRLSNPVGRRQLLGAWAGGDRFPISAFNDDEQTWLFATGARRAELLAQASPALRKRWLVNGSLTSTDVIAWKTSWAQDDYAAIARVLQSEPDTWRSFVQSAGSDPVMLRTVLPSPQRDVFAWLESRCATEPPLQSATALEDLASSGALGQLPLDAISCGLRVAWSEALQSVWVEAAIRAGLPESVARALSKGSARRPEVDGVLPPLVPDAHWVNAIPVNVLLEASAWTCGDRAWRRWWVECLRCHMDLSQNPATVSALFSAPALAWVAGATIDGELAKTDALSTLARWMRASHGVTPEAIYEICAACGFADASFWAAFISGQQSFADLPPTAEGMKVLVALQSAGVSSLSSVAAAIQEGASIDWLEPFVDRASFALLACATRSTVSPPVDPPLQWDPALDELLSRQISAPAFWKRWQGVGGMRIDLLDWILTRVRARSGARLLEQAADAHRSGQRVDLAALAIVGSGLPRDVQVEQAARWASSGHADRDEALHCLLTASDRATAIEWLWHRTTSWNFRRQVPADLTCRELRALLPWLEPALVVQEAMSETKLRADEQPLLASVVQRLHAGSYQPAPCPTPTLARLRPDWVRQLSAVPGWEHWTVLLETARRGDRQEPS